MLELSESQSEFYQYLADVFKNEFAFEETEKRLKADAREIEKPLSDLALSEYFESEDSSFRELCMLAFFCGKALVPSSLAEGILFKSRFANFDPTKTFAFNFPIDLERDPELKALFSSNAAAPEQLIVLNDDSGAYISSGFEPSKLVAHSSVDSSRYYFLCEALESKKSQLLGKKETKRLELELMLLHASELAGLGAASVAITVEYAKERKQFSVPIGGFQAVQHKLAEMHVSSEASEALSDFAAALFDENDEVQMEAAATAALRYARKEIPLVIEKSIQAHGGIGFTWEYPLHYFLRRAKFLELIYSSRFEGSRALTDHFTDC